jgi:hypothetical protein
VHLQNRRLPSLVAMLSVLGDWTDGQGTTAPRAAVRPDRNPSFPSTLVAHFLVTADGLLWSF